jgi:hypothetical protein
VYIYEAQITKDFMLKCACWSLVLFYLFVVYLMMLPVAQIVASNDGMIMNDELERMWKEMVMALFKVLS